MKPTIDQLIHAGRLDEALQLAKKDVEQMRSRIDTEDPETTHTYAKALEVYADILREMDDIEAARDVYQQALDQLFETPKDYPLIGSLHASLGAIGHVLDEPKEAAHHWQIAIRYFENCDPPLMVDVATIANNLGFLYKAIGDLDSAENCFLRSLEVLNNLFGKYDEQTATVYCNLGTLYHQAAFYDQALNMHMTALDTRRKMLGRSHPDTAQSNNNLALVFAQNGDCESAKEHFENAIKAFHSLGPEYSEDLATVLNNYCGFLYQIGEERRAEEITAEYQPDGAI